MSTRDKIIEESRRFFNQHGYGASSLYQIAQQIGISRGNLTYHFKEKDLLLDHHLYDLKTAHDLSLTNSTLVPSWQSLTQATEDFHKLQKAYAFIFFDKSVLSLPPVTTLISTLRDNNIKAQMSMIDISVKIGNMKKEPFAGVYHNISRTYWIISYFWLLSKTFTSKDEVSWDKIMWSMYLPHFTDKGLDSFKEHFGKVYFESLGVAYEKYLQGVVAF